MLKTVAAGAAMFMIAAGAVALAQQPPAAGPDGGRRPIFAAEDHAAFLDARIAALRAGLRLTSEQEKAWPAVLSHPDQQMSRCLLILAPACVARNIDGPNSGTIRLTQVFSIPTPSRGNYDFRNLSRPRGQGT